MLLSGITTLGKTVLLIVAMTFIAWAIITAIFVPKRIPTFPRRLDAYLLVSALLFVAQMTAVLWVTGTQEVEEAHTPPKSRRARGDDRDAGAGGRRGRRQRGLRELPDARLPHARGCGRERGGRAESRRGEAARRARRRAVTNGKGAMPPFGDQLTETQIADVAAYVPQSQAPRKDSVRDRITASRAGARSST